MAHVRITAASDIPLVRLSLFWRYRPGHEPAAGTPELRLQPELSVLFGRCRAGIDDTGPRVRGRAGIPPLAVEEIAPSRGRCRVPHRFTRRTAHVRKIAGTCRGPQGNRCRSPLSRSRPTARSLTIKRSGPLADAGLDRCKPLAPRPRPGACPDSSQGPTGTISGR